MGEINLDKDKIREFRADLVELGFDRVLEEIVMGTTSLYWTNNFPYIFNTELGWYRKIDPELAEAVDGMVSVMKFDLTKYRKREYYSTLEAHERAFVIYKRLHDEVGIPFKRLFG